ncbi:hypothetical protein AVEN_242651-1, partial [Araneus ventricosus]
MRKFSVIDCQVYFFVLHF